MGKRFTIISTHYTGLKDKNDVEIYEGDIITGIADAVIKGMMQKGQIKWGKSGFCIETKLQGKVPLHLFYALEVIGNIYENNELLEEQG